MVTKPSLVKRIEIMQGEIDKMQEELDFLKKTVMKKSTGKPVKLRGVWKGVDFSEEEIEAVRKSSSRMS